MYAAEDGWHRNVESDIGIFPSFKSLISMMKPFSLPKSRALRSVLNSAVRGTRCKVGSKDSLVKRRSFDDPGSSD